MTSFALSSSISLLRPPLLTKLGASKTSVSKTWTALLAILCVTVVTYSPYAKADGPDKEFESATRYQSPEEAQRLFAQEFKAMARQYIALAQQNGWTSVRGVSFTELLASFDDVVVILNPPNVRLMVGSRQTAHWNNWRNKKEVRVNFKDWNKTPESAKPGLAFHELACVNGYNDRFYEMSIRLDLMQTEKFDFENPISDKYVIAGAGGRSGGSTGVGGGGDEDEIQAKTTLFKKHFEIYLKPDELYVNEWKAGFFDLKIEIFKSDRSLEHVQVQCDPRTGEPFITVGLGVLKQDLESAAFFTEALKAIAFKSAYQEKPELRLSVFKRQGTCILQ